MPQIAIIPTTSPTPPPALSTASSEPSSFSPHLNKAIQKINEQTGNTAPDQGATTGDRTTTAANRGNSDIAQSPALADIGMSTDQLVEEILLLGNHQQDIALLSLGESLSTVLNTPAVANSGVVRESQFPETASIVAQLVSNVGKGQPFSPGQANQNLPTLPVQGLLSQSTQNLPIESNQDLFIQSSQGSSALPIAVPTFLPLPATTNANSNNPLIKQLQSIIDGGEKGITLSITASGKTSRVSTNGGTIDIRTDTMPQQPIGVGISLDQAVDPVTAPSYGALRLEGGADQQQGPATSRQTLQQQYFEGKLAAETKNDSNSGAGDKQPQNGTTTQTGLASNNDAGTLANTENPTAFSQILAQSPTGYKPLGHEPLRPVLLPSGTVVYQEEVIRHIAERFQITRRDSDTRVNLQLHPAELGELRIDLSVKNGTVRANVVASTQIAQDIIEKNMPKLRSILEQQGFSIDEILVSNSSPAVDDFNHFDRQHYDDQGSQPSSSQSSDTPTAVFTLDGLNPVQERSAGSVNVKI